MPDIKLVPRVGRSASHPDDMTSRATRRDARRLLPRHCHRIIVMPAQSCRPRSFYLSMARTPLAWQTVTELAFRLLERHDAFLDRNARQSGQLERQLSTWLAGNARVRGRPFSDIRCRELVAPKRSVAHAPRPPRLAPQQWHAQVGLDAAPLDEGRGARRSRVGTTAHARWQGARRTFQAQRP